MTTQMDTRGRASRRHFAVPEETGIFVILLIVVIGFSMLSSNFRTVSNGSTLLLNGSVIAFLALGQAFVLLTGGIDLSTGANVALTGVFAAQMMQHGLPWTVAALLALLLGAFVGTVNGLVIHYVKVPAFIVTFATQGVASSIPLIITKGNSVPVLDSNFSFVGQGKIAGAPVPVVMLITAALVAWFLLKSTIYGRHVYAFGGNREAARLAGVNLARTTVSVYALSGLCAGFGGLISTSRLMVGFPTTGLGNELFFSITAAVVGGVSLFGGTGSVPGAMIGAVLIAAVSDGMNVANVSSYWQPLVIGLIILAGVSLDTYRRYVTGRGLPPGLQRLLSRRRDPGVPDSGVAPAVAPPCQQQQPPPPLPIGSADLVRVPPRRTSSKGTS
jgi:ribose transport system permease protein